MAYIYIYIYMYLYIYIYISYSGIQWQDWSSSSKNMKFEYIRLNVGNPKGAYPIGEGLWLGYRHRRGVLVDSDRYSRKRWSASYSRSTKMHWWVCVRGSTKSDSQRREMKEMKVWGILMYMTWFGRSHPRQLSFHESQFLLAYWGSGISNREKLLN